MSFHWPLKSPGVREVDEGGDRIRKFYVVAVRVIRGRSFAFPFGHRLGSFRLRGYSATGSVILVPSFPTSCHKAEGDKAERHVDIDLDQSSVLWTVQLCIGLRFHSARISPPKYRLRTSVRLCRYTTLTRPLATIHAVSLCLVISTFRLEWERHYHQSSKLRSP